MSSTATSPTSQSTVVTITSGHVTGQASSPVPWPRPKNSTVVRRPKNYAHWDGHRWSVRVGPPNGAALFAVSSDGPQRWAVGSKDVPHNTSALTPFIQVSG